jgi:hypothetical protein
MKKKLFAVVASALVVGVCVVSTDDAQAQVLKLSPAQIQQFIQLSNVHGTIAIAPTAVAPPNQAFSCNHITVYASSKEMTVCTPSSPGDFCAPQPKWTRHVQASVVNGQCSYSIVVPYNQPFSVSAGTDFVPAGMCGWDSLQTSGIGGTVQTSTRASSINQSFTVKGLQYTECPH